MEEKSKQVSNGKVVFDRKKEVEKEGKLNEEDFMTSAEKLFEEFNKKYSSESEWFKHPPMDKGIYKRYQK